MISWWDTVKKSLNSDCLDFKPPGKVHHAKTMIIINKLTNLEEIANSAAEQFVTLAREAISWRGTFSVALSGGSTPEPLYRKLSKTKDSGRVPWNKIQFFWGDERTVPPDHPESNYHLAYRTLLEPLEIPDENIHRIQTELKPAEAASAYQEDLRSFFPHSPPRFDLIYLGLGEDGHTASLFPQTKALQVSDSSHWVMANFVPALSTWRITFTHHLINAAHNVTFLVAGEKKKQRVHQVLQGRYQPQVLPAQIIQPEGSLTWFVDQEAGALL